jgi:sugar lactone lactonase YvrE
MTTIDGGQRGLAAGRGWAAPALAARVAAGAAVLFLLLGVRPAPAAGPGPTWEEVQQAAKAAHDRGDHAAYRTEVGRLLVLISGHPDTVVAMGKAEALLGHPAAAMDWLRSFADMGLVRDLAAEPDLASLRQDPGMPALLAHVAANRLPVSRSRRAFTLSDPDLLTEDLAWDPLHRRFLVSSIRQSKVVAVDARTGAAADLVPAGRDAIWGVLALAVDARRGVLWATTAAMPQVHGYRPADSGHTAVLRYDLATGRLQKRYDLPLPLPAPPPSAAGSAAEAASAKSGASAAAEAAPPAGAATAPAAPTTDTPAAEAERERVLGDMTVSPAGDVYASEAVTGAVYVIRRAQDTLETLVPPGIFASPQTPAVTPDGRRLLVADYVRGIGVVDLASRAVTWMEHPRGVAVNGIDGMYLHGTSLFAVQNGTEPNRVVRFRLDPKLQRILGWEPIESNSPGLGAPTHGTVVGRNFYFLANSGWDQLADDGAVKPGGKLTPASVLRVRL